MSRWKWRMLLCHEWTTSSSMDLICRYPGWVMIHVHACGILTWLCWLFSAESQFFGRYNPPHHYHWLSVTCTFQPSLMAFPVTSACIDLYGNCRRPLDVLGTLMPWFVCCHRRPSCRRLQLITISRQTATVMAINHDGHDCSKWAINDLLIAGQRECNEVQVHIIHINLNFPFKLELLDDMQRFFGC